MTTRYAIYFSPGEDSELGQFGQSILGRSATSRRSDHAHSTYPDHADWYRLTEKPAHYGFHATLKAPFELKKNHTEDSLIKAVSNFAKQQSTIELQSLYPRNFGGFMALTVNSEMTTLASFAFNCVESFEMFRKDLSDADIQRRKTQSLTDRQEALLLKYGYPYVADQFQFHITLSEKLGEYDGEFKAWVISEYDRFISTTPVLDRISVFAQTDRQTSFVQIGEAKFKDS